jgi:predicted DNA-binding mobile mystery protein A
MDKQKNKGKKLRRRQLDALYAKLRPLTEASNVSGCWLRDIRDALGISSVQLAKRLGISKQAYLKLEANEEKRTIALGTLGRVAEAVGFRVVYAIVPSDSHSSLEAMLRERAVKVATHIVNKVSRTMALEDQSIAKKEREQQIADLADELVAELDKRLWDQD